MQERTALDDQLAALGRIERDIEDNIGMIELGEQEGDRSVVADAEAALKALRAEVGRRELEALLAARQTPTTAISRSMRRRRHESQDWASMLLRMYGAGRAARLQGRLSGRDRRRGSRNQSATIEIKAATPSDGSKAKPACIAWCASRLRLQCAPPYLVRERRVFPVIDDRIVIDIKESDVRTDTCGPAAGGQHVNKTNRRSA